MELKLTLRGTAPLLMHNARLSNPLDPLAKALKKVTSKRAKSEDDYEEMARVEFLGSLYMDPDVGPYVPPDNLFRALVDAGRKRKLGTKITSGVIILSDTNPLSYDGPRTAEALWADPAFRHQASVKVGMQRVIRTRPVFAGWATSANLYLDTEVLDYEDLVQVVEIAGRLVGLGDWRPRFGRFEAVLEQTGAP